jgi:hypothetical protein
VLVIPPNTKVLVARAAQQLDYLPAPRRPTMQSARFNLIPHPRRAGHSRTSHVLTSDVVESFCSNSFPARSATVRSADSPQGYLLKTENAVQRTQPRARIQSTQLRQLSRGADQEPVDTDTEPARAHQHFVRRGSWARDPRHRHGSRDQTVARWRARCVAKAITRRVAP